MNTDKLLAQLVERLLKTYSRDLVSVVLYGSAASGDTHGRHSDLNVLCVLREIGIESLHAFEPIVLWWRSLGNPAPLLLSENELARSADSFPIEFLDMQEQHRVLHGSAALKDLRIDPVYHRVQVEHELKAKLIALRHRYAGVYRDRKAVRTLMADALPSFAALFRHALMVAGETPPLKKHEVIQQAAGKFGFSAEPFLAVIELRQGRRKPGQVDAASTFRGYYEGVARVSEAVDRLEKEKAEL